MTPRSLLLVICATILASYNAAWGADESQPPQTGELILTKFFSTPIHTFERIKLGGSIKGTNYTYPYATPNTDIRVSNRLIFKPDLDARLDEHVRLYGQMKLRTDLPQSNTKTRMIPQEAYLDINLSHLNIRGGYQIFSWGMADLINPTDRLTPQDYSDVFDFEKEGIPAIKFTYFYNKLSIEGIWMPIPDESELPYQNSRFVAPFLTTIDNPLFPIFELPPANYNVTVNSLDPEKRWESSQFGARILATIGRFDFGLSYFNGYEKLPRLETIMGTPDPLTGVVPVTVNEVFPREHVLGFNVATGFKGLNLKTESALVVPYHTTHEIGAAGELHYIYVVGGDYTFFEIINRHNFSINLEFTQEMDKAGAKKDDFGRLFQKSLLSRLEYQFSEYLKVRVSNVYNFDNRDYYLQPEVMWEPIDDLELKLGADVLDGPSNTLLGLFDKDDRIYTSIKYYF